MAISSKIKGLIVEIGGDTTAHGKALESADKQSSSLSSELRSINKLLKFDPGNADLLAQKQAVLADAISATREKLDTLREAEQQVQEQFERGDASAEQVRALQREIIATEGKLEAYERAADETADALASMGNEAQDTAGDVDAAADSEREAAKESEDLGDSLNLGAVVGFAALTAACKQALDALAGCAEVYREHSTEMGKLTTAFETNGYSAAAATRTYQALQGILGETDQAVEAANHLSKLCETEEELDTWTEICTGVFGQFGASLPIENLTEAANETARTGQVVGGLADALNWAAAEGETFGVQLRENTDENAAWNQSVQDAASAEDYFNLALQECSNTQERQQLITKTLSGLYAKAAKQYKTTNAEVIKANESNEKWNASLAGIGEHIQPAISDIKLFGAEVLDSMEEPIAEAADFLSNSLLPKLRDFGSWVNSNSGAIKAGIVGVATAMATYEAATLAAEISQKGLKVALEGSTVATKLLSAAQALTPWGLVAVGVTGVVTALTAYLAYSQSATEQVDLLTAADRQLMDAAAKTAESMQEQRAATEQAVASTTAQMGHVSELAAELQTLADSSGHVREQDQARAQFILGELNSALGTEYTMTDGVIQKYGELKDGITDVINAKLANALIEAHSEAYMAAIENEQTLVDGAALAYSDYLIQLDAAKTAEAEYVEAKAYAEEQVAKYGEEGALGAISEVQRKKAAWEQEKAALASKTTAHQDAAQALADCRSEITSYEEAQTAAIQGNYDQVKSIYEQKGQTFVDYTGTVDEESQKVLERLNQEVIDTGKKAEETRQAWENGVEGYTAEMVEEAEQAHKDAIAAFDKVYDEGSKIGKNLGKGLSTGMESQRSVLYSRAKSIIGGVIREMERAAAINSPSKKGKYIGQMTFKGVDVGMEDERPHLIKTAEQTIDDLFGVFGGLPDGASGQAVVEHLEQQVTAPVPMMADENTETLPILRDLLAAVKAGHVLVVNSGALVAEIVSDMDTALQLRQAAAERGTI